VGGPLRGPRRIRCAQSGACVMSHASQRRTADLVPVSVPGADDLLATQSDGRRWAALKPMCDSLGIDTWTQQRKLNGKSWATTSIMTVVAGDGKPREMAMIDSRTIPMWLATIDENKVTPESRPKLIAYQREAAAALDAYFNQRTAAPAMNQLDVLRAALDQIEAAQRDAAESRMIAQRTSDRLDAIEGKHNWLAALGYARQAGLPTHTRFLQRLGKRAALIARTHGVEPNPVQHQLYGVVNSFPAWVWDLAVEEMSP
jgi:hypothetical protein